MLKKLLCDQVEVAIDIVDLAEYSEKLQIHNSLMKELTLKYCLITTIKDIYAFLNVDFITHSKTKDFLILLNDVKELVHKQLQLSEFYDSIMHLIDKYLEKESWCDQSTLLRFLIKELKYTTSFMHF